MKTSISSKVFLAVLSTALFVVLAMGLANGLSFTRGFLGYLNELALQRVDSVEPRFEAAYKAYGSWEFLQAGRNRQAWFELIRPDIPAHTPDPGGRMTPIADLTGAVFRISLLDASSNLVMGYYEVSPDAERRPIVVDGETVGWLTVTPFQSVTEAGGQRFVNGQLLSGLGVGLVALLLAALIAWWVARRLLGPVKLVAAATHRLAAGHYRERVPVSSQDEVGQLARDFNQLAHSLERNELMRREFMADVSHELRTPLAVLRGELEAIDDGVRKLDAGTLQSLLAEVGMLGKLVDDLYQLSLADVGALAYRKQRLDLAEELALSVSLFEERFHSHQLRLCFQASANAPWVLADAARLQQLFANLLENSLRYTQAGGELRVLLRNEGDWLVVDLLDSAPGVPAEQLPRLFERFFRGESSRNRASGGAGLGLAICHAIVQAHGGELAAQPSPLGGLWLSIRLPREVH